MTPQFPREPFSMFRLDCAVLDSMPDTMWCDRVTCCLPDAFGRPLRWGDVVIGRPRDGSQGLIMKPFEPELDLEGFEVLGVVLNRMRTATRF